MVRVKISTAMWKTGLSPPQRNYKYMHQEKKNIFFAHPKQTQLQDQKLK